MKILVTLFLGMMFTGDNVEFTQEPFVSIEIVKKSECPEQRTVRGGLVRYADTRRMIIQWCENYEGASYESDSNSPDRDYNEM